MIPAKFGNVSVISIIMPTLNQARFLPLALDSVLEQRFDGKLEVIVLDGGSTDGSLEILKSYADRIRFLSENDGGQSEAVNKGLKLASGNVVGWLNSDDLYKPGAFQYVLRTFENPDVQWIFGKVDVINAEGQGTRRLVTWGKNRRLPQLTFGILLQANWISQMGVFWRRSFQESVGPLREDLHLAMDYDWWLRFWESSPGVFLDQTIASFRMYGASKSGSSFRKQLDEAYSIASDHAGNRFHLDLLRHRVNRFLIAQLYRLNQA